MVVSGTNLPYDSVSRIACHQVLVYFSSTSQEISARVNQHTATGSSKILYDASNGETVKWPRNSAREMVAFFPTYPPSRNYVGDLPPSL